MYQRTPETYWCYQSKESEFMKPLTDEYIIDKHIRGEDMSGEEERYFQERMQDKSFAESVAEMKLIYQAGKAHDREEMKKTLIQAEDEINRTDWWKKLAFIIVTILILSGVYYFSKSHGNNQQKIFASYCEPYPNVIDPLTKGNVEEGNIYHLYERGKYDQVIDTLVKKADKTDDELFYLAQSYIAKDNFREASLAMNEINSDKYRFDVAWYQALLCLRLDQNCSLLFEEITNDSPYRKKAEEIWVILHDSQ